MPELLKLFLGNPLVYQMATENGRNHVKPRFHHHKVELDPANLNFCSFINHILAGDLLNFSCRFVKKNRSNNDKRKCVS